MFMVKYIFFQKRTKHNSSFMAIDINAFTNIRVKPIILDTFRHPPEAALPLQIDLWLVTRFFSTSGGFARQSTSQTRRK